MLIYILFSLKPTVSVRILSTTDLSSWFKLKLPEQFYIQISFQTKQRGSAKEKAELYFISLPGSGVSTGADRYSASLRTKNEREPIRWWSPSGRPSPEWVGQSVICLLNGESKPSKLMREMMKGRGLEKHADCRPRDRFSLPFSQSSQRVPGFDGLERTNERTDSELCTLRTH